MSTPPRGFDLKAYLAEQRSRIDSALTQWIPLLDGPAAKVTEAMRYSLLAGGKRVRPILLLSAAEAVGDPGTKLLPAACALECIHTYSLIHDDLPAMDDDDLRRGRPTCHKVFGEAIAILAGDGLLTYAFELLAHPTVRRSLDPGLQNEAIFLLARAAGVSGMVGGQTADVLREGKTVDEETLAYIHRHKTGALIQASVEIGGLLGGGDQSQVRALTAYGSALGLAFQVVDDLLDVEGDVARMGKPVGSDLRREKATYPALYGLEETRKQARRLLHEALSALEPLDHRSDPLRAIARYVVDRDR